MNYNYQFQILLNRLYLQFFNQICKHNSIFIEATKQLIIEVLIMN